jgi:hypothetical protein
MRILPLSAHPARELPTSPRPVISDLIVLSAIRTDLVPTHSGTDLPLPILGPPSFLPGPSVLR